MRLRPLSMHIRFSHNCFVQVYRWSYLAFKTIITIQSRVDYTRVGSHISISRRRWRNFKDYGVVRENVDVHAKTDFTVVQEYTNFEYGCTFRVGDFVVHFCQFCRSMLSVASFGRWTALTSLQLGIPPPPCQFFPDRSAGVRNEES